jgi:hypothetical protein
MLQQRLGHDLKSAFFTEARQHLPEDFGLYVRKYIRESLQGGIEFAQVGLVEAMVARRSRRARRLLCRRRRASDVRRPDQRREDGRHSGRVSTLAWQAGRCIRDEVAVIYSQSYTEGDARACTADGLNKEVVNRQINITRY